MADYYPLIARAVAGLERNTGDARRALYERARTALVAQLRGVTPALSESDVTRERLALEEAIRKVEAESARQTWIEPSQKEAPHRVRAPEMPRWDDKPGPPTQERQSSRSPLPSRADALARKPAPAPRQSAGLLQNPMLGNDRYVDPVFDQPIGGAQTAKAQPAPPPPQPQRHPLRGRSTGERPANERPGGERRSLPDSGLAGLRTGGSETNEPGGVPSRSPKSGRESKADVASPDFDARAFDVPDARDQDDMLQDMPAQRMLEPAIDDETQPIPSRIRMPPFPVAEEPAGTPRRSLRKYAMIIVGLLLLAGVVGSLLLLWPTVAQIYSSLRAPSSIEVASEPTVSAPSKMKITERFEPGGQQATQPQPAAVTQGGAAVAQRVVLYEEDPNDPQGKRFVGSAIWRTENVSPGPGMPAEIAVRADVEIPERRIAMTWSLRRNNDPNLPASHTVEIMFRLPQDFPAGGVLNVPGILMKQAEQSRGTPLSGLAVKVTNGFFLIGLSSVEADRERNVQLLKNRGWFDIPVVYNNNRRAILALEKGALGERAFADAFGAWRQ